MCNSLGQAAIVSDGNMTFNCEYHTISLGVLPASASGDFPGTNNVSCAYWRCHWWKTVLRLSTWCRKLSGISSMADKNQLQIINVGPPVWVPDDSAHDRDGSCSHGGRCAQTNWNIRHLQQWLGSWHEDWHTQMPQLLSCVTHPVLLVVYLSWGVVADYQCPAIADQRMQLLASRCGDV